MKTLYFDCFSGISGDMTLGALLDLGIDENILLDNLKLLNIDGYEIKIEKKLKNGISGTYVTVILENEKDIHEQSHNQHEEHHHSHDHDHKHTHENSHAHEHHHEHRNLRDIEAIIDNSRLNANIKQLSKGIFRVVAEAEGKIHGKPVEEVHFHEVGALDSIVDIIGVAICIDYLGVEKIAFSKIPLSRGFVKCQHGVFPLPAPATMEILKDIPVYFNDANFELVTPTGAAFVKALGHMHYDMTDIQIERIGYGLGKKTYEIPNVLRVMLIKENEEKKDQIVKLETNIDDMTPEQLGFLMEKLLSEGALDVYFTNIIMKKNRPAVMLSVLCSEDKRDYFNKILLTQTSTFGTRCSKMERDILDRAIVQLDTEHGSVRFKFGIFEGEIIKYSPEYEDCRMIAQKTGIPIQQIYGELIKKLEQDEYLKLSDTHHGKLNKLI